MGRPRKPATMVTLTLSKIQVLVNRLGYKDKQSLFDDLAMGVIPPTANSDATKSETPMAVGAEKSAEVVCSGSETEIVQKSKVAWADVVESEEMEKEMETEMLGRKLEEAENEEATIGESEVGKSWTDIVKGNRTHENGQNLEFYPAGKEVVLSDEDWMEGERIWKYTLVAKFGRSRPTYDEVQKWASVNWKKNTPGIAQLKPGIFLFEFQSEEQKQDVLRKNWTFYHTYPIMFKLWDVDKPIDQIQFETQPLWIQLPGLPPRFWTPKNLSKIVSYIGTPLSTDKLTANRTKLDFARVLVEVKNTGTILPNEIPIRSPNGIYMQKVRYEKDMHRCGFCGIIGHDEVSCWKKKAVEKKQNSTMTKLSKEQGTDEGTQEKESDRSAVQVIRDQAEEVSDLGKEKESAEGSQKEMPTSKGKEVTRNNKPQSTGTVMPGLGRSGERVGSESRANGGSQHRSAAKGSGGGKLVKSPNG